jgi:hypothetical protein
MNITPPITTPNLQLNTCSTHSTKEVKVNILNSKMDVTLWIKPEVTNLSH